MSARFPCHSVSGVVFAQCDAADLPVLMRRTWRFQAKRGVVSRDGNTQMQATSLLCGWTQVRYLNGNKLDLRRANLGKLESRGYAPACKPMQVRDNLWRVQRSVGSERLQICFADFSVAQQAGELMRRMTKAEVLAAVAARRANRRTGCLPASGFFDGREDLYGHTLDFEERAQMRHVHSGAEAK